MEIEPSILRQRKSPVNGPEKEFKRTTPPSHSPHHTLPLCPDPLRPQNPMRSPRHLPDSVMSNHPARRAENPSSRGKSSVAPAERRSKEIRNQLQYRHLYQSARHAENQSSRGKSSVAPAERRSKEIRNQLPYRHLNQSARHAENPSPRGKSSVGIAVITWIKPTLFEHPCPGLLAASRIRRYLGNKT